MKLIIDCKSLTKEGRCKILGHLCSWLPGLPLETCTVPTDKSGSDSKAGEKKPGTTEPGKEKKK